MTVLSIWCLHVILPSKAAPSYVTLFTNGISRPLFVVRHSGDIDRLSFPFTDIYVPAAHHEFIPECMMFHDVYSLVTMFVFCVCDISSAIAYLYF
jgi:hypothetical protein